MTATLTGGVGDPPVSVVGTAEERIVRTLARFLSASTLVFAILLAPGAYALSGIIPLWWTALAGVAIVGPMLALWPASNATGMRWIGCCGTTAAVGYLAALLSWILLVHGHIPANRDVWLATFPGLVAMATALTWRPVTSLLYVAVGAGTAEVLRFVTRDNQQDVVLSVEIVSVVVFCSLFVVATIAAVTTGRALDRAISTSVVQSVASASLAARAVERSRFHALVHDRVMSVLLGLSRHGNTPGLREQAAIAVTALDGLRESDVAAEDLDVHAAVALIRSALVQVDGHTPVQVDVSPDAPDVPRAAARALASAASEALRNSVRHADAGPQRADRVVAVDADARGLQVVVADNGCGFDPDRAPGFRLGLTTDILERMATAPDCSVESRSAVGRGTQVWLSWSPAGEGGDAR